MIKQYFNLALVLLASWSVYGYCQGDHFLPQIVGFIMIATLLIRIRSQDKHFALFATVPLSITMIVTLIAGFAWRNMYPAPQEAVSPFPAVTAAFQSATILCAIIIWLKPFTRRNLTQLFFLAWLTVATSINVPFTDPMLFIFCAFCIVAIAIVILHTSQKPKERKYLFRYYRDFTFFSVLLVMLTTGLFYGISKSIVFADQVFMNLMSGYILPQHYTNFLNIEPIMRLGPPGSSAWDKRPVLEISTPNIEGFYLKTQVFEDFDNGIWLEQKDIPKIPLPDTLIPQMINGKMTMFTSFDDIIPTPTGIAAAKGKAAYTKSQYNILYTEDDLRSRIFAFSMSLDKSSIDLTREERRRTTAVPQSIAPFLTAISSSFIDDETGDSVKAQILEDFFHDHFQYSLDVNFVADNEGLLRMILEKRPAYCTYFATAMTMLLRSQGIPARVATGFLVDENINHKTNTLLARVQDAHAWVEVFIADAPSDTGAALAQWQIMDPTPSSVNTSSGKGKWPTPSKIAENIWLATLRFNAFMENLDREKLKKNALAAFILILLIINSKKIYRKAVNLLKSANKNMPLKREKADPIQAIYLRYEHYLKIVFGETRADTDTDSAVIQRLKQRAKVPAETVAKMESFIHQYHACRFGLRTGMDLQKVIRDIERNAKADQTGKTSL